MDQLSDKILKTVFVCFFVLFTINSCKDDYTSVIPYVYVDLNINLDNQTQLNVPYGYVYFNGGYGGIIIFTDLADSSNPYLAFDRTCTYEYGVSASLSVVTTDGSGVATCPDCGSRFMLTGGSGTPIKGPAAEPLKQYRAIYSGGRIIVSN